MVQVHAEQLEELVEVDGARVVDVRDLDVLDDTPLVLLGDGPPAKPKEANEKMN